jgi:hypothetical protein
VEQEPVNRFVFHPDNLDVLRFRASQETGIDEHVEWMVGYSDTVLGVQDGVTSRIVLGTLHAGGKGGWAEIDVASIFLSEEDVPEDLDGLEAWVQSAAATEALYDFARSHLRGMLSTINAKAKLPKKSPDPVMFVLKKHEDDETPDEAFEG